MSIKKKVAAMMGNGRSMEENLYEVLSEKDYSYGVYKKEDLGEGMWRVDGTFGSWWKMRYLVDEVSKKAYEIMDENMYFVQFGEEDVNWESLNKLPEEAVERARAMFAMFPSFVGRFENGVAQVSWQLNPDGRYYMDEDGFGMSDDEEIEIYGFVDRQLRVLVPFEHIDEDWNRLREMRKEAENLMLCR